MSGSPDPSQLPDDNFEVVQPGALEAIARADINQQIATAKQFPRSLDIKKHQSRMIQMASYSPEAAAECFYCIPRNNLDIYGPSVRLSEIVAYVWGNLYSVSRILDINPVSRLVTAQAVAWDLEANVKEGIEYTQRITIKGPEGQKTAALAATAMAGRNAKLKLVPRVVWWPVYERCLAVARGDVTPLGDRIAKMMKAFAVWGITLDRILAKFDYENVAQFTDQDIPALIGYHTSIKEEASTPEEIFPKAGVGEMGRQTADTQGTNRQDEPGAVRESEQGSTVSTGVTNDANSPRRRGRRPLPRNPDGTIIRGNAESAPATGTGGTSAQGTTQAAEQVQTTAAATNREQHQYGPNDEASKIAQFPTQAQAEPAQASETPEDPKTALAAKLRGMLEASNKSEAALMAKLREWGFGNNLPSEAIRLEDYGENTLTQIIERWPKLATHVR